MRERTFGRLGWRSARSATGCGAWRGWTGSDDDRVARLARARGRARLQLLRHRLGLRRGAQRAAARPAGRASIRTSRLYVATKIPPKNRTWPSRRGFTLDDCFPPDHIREYAEKSLENLGLPRIDLLQFHVWEDAWADDDRWQRRDGRPEARGADPGVGVSVNRWEPCERRCETLRTGLVDAVQVIYNIFDQAPEDELFPLCRELDIAVIARVPFDEGTLTGTLTTETPLARGRLAQHLLRPREPRRRASTAPRPCGRSCPQGMTMPELALRWILPNPDVATIIPGMRKLTARRGQHRRQRRRTADRRS